MANEPVSTPKYPVTVLLSTYNPVWTKVRATLLSVVAQQGIDFEIVITDDGSGTDHREQLLQILEERRFPHYRYVKNEVNVGTVKNLLGAALGAEGEYTFHISPGDMLTDPLALSRFYHSAKSRNAVICFCDAIYYDPTEGVTPLGGFHADPSYPQLFTDDAPRKLQQISLIWGNYLLGAALLLTKECACKYYKLSARSSRYNEDAFSMIYASLDGIRVYHCPEKLVWYEYGTGVSTSTSTAAFQRMKTDFDNSFRLLSGYRPYTPALAARCRIRFLRNPLLRILYLFFCHPLVSLQLLRIFTLKKSIMDVSGVSTEWPESMLNPNDNP